MTTHRALRSLRRPHLVTALLMTLLIALLLAVHVDIKGHFEGIFILKGRDRALLEIQDDLYLGDGGRVIYSLDFDPLMALFHRPPIHGPGESYLEYSWQKNDGSGFVRRHLPYGQLLLTCFSRFKDDSGRDTHGLFVGGGLPPVVEKETTLPVNNTGMAYFDGRRWYHVWCNVNEGIDSGTRPGHMVFPAEWQFLGSRVLNESARSLTITSRHEVKVDNVPLRIDRYASFRAGDTFFTLTIKITNTGRTWTSYYYAYGDEPWVGKFGTSAGNVGWVKDRFVEYEEKIDADKYRYAGYYDYGNPAAGEAHGPYTGTANFIEWLGGNHPDLVYFSNEVGGYTHSDAVKVPLKSDARFLGLQWGPRVIHPGRSQVITLAIGMAGHDSKTGLPVKPDISADNLP